MTGIWNGVKAAWRFFDRVMTVVLLMSLCFWVGLWVTESYQKGHILNFDELMAGPVESAGESAAGK
jgi:hypothetical protein